MKKSIALALCSFFFGMAIITTIPSMKKFVRLKQYTVKHSESLFKKWKKEELVMNYSGQVFSNFIEENSRFIIFFWATWCPYCKEEVEANKFLEERNITVIGLPYDHDSEYFDWFVSKHELKLDNLFFKDSTEKRFIQRKGHFYIPLIPSWWLIENGMVSEIFIGTKGKEKLLLYFK